VDRLRRWTDIDQLLIFFLLAVTVNQMAHYLATFAPDGWRFVAWFQAVAIDAAIWRSAYWFRRYTGRKQRRYALLGVAAFAAASAWYNREFYAMRDSSLPTWQTWLMGAILPAGVALLSYLHGVKDSSRFAVSKTEPAPRSGKPATSKTQPAPEPQASHVCGTCGRSFGSQQALNAHSPAQCAERKRKIEMIRKGGGD